MGELVETEIIVLTNENFLATFSSLSFFSFPSAFGDLIPLPYLTSTPLKLDWMGHFQSVVIFCEGNTIERKWEWTPSPRALIKKRLMSIAKYPLSISLFVLCMCMRANAIERMEARDVYDGVWCRITIRY